MESAYEYGSRVGFWRLMRVFAERQMIPTIYAVGMALDRNPQAAETMARQAEGWQWRAAGAGIKLGPRVCRLPAGGKRIRTGGPTSEPTPALMALIGKCSPHQLVASREKATGSLRALSAVSAEKCIARLDRPALARPPDLSTELRHDRFATTAPCVVSEPRFCPGDTTVTNDNRKRGNASGGT